MEAPTLLPLLLLLAVKMGRFFESVGNFFTGGDNIPWCDRDIIAISPLSNNRKAVVLWNWQGYQATITAQWSSIGLASSTVVIARDLWAVCLLS